MMTKQAKEVHAADIQMKIELKLDAMQPYMELRTIAMRHFEGTTEFPNLKESTVCGWKDEYNKIRKKSPCQPVVKLPTKQ